jgi:carbonic anhydrase/acetyltransferase-like protein (isoleucine patch superfamily)
MRKDATTRIPVDLLVPLFSFLIAGLPLALSVAGILFAPTKIWQLVAVVCAPAIFSISYVFLCGLLSMPFHRAIIAGRFPRNTSHAVYGRRRLYGLCWGAVFYFTPIYFFFLSIPPLKIAFLRLFGYRGSLDVNIAPDAWIRDLPILSVGNQVYIANKATVGTNMCLNNGMVLVDKVTLNDRSMIGHMAKIAPGCMIGAKVEVGVDCAIGIRAIIGAKSKVGTGSLVNHGCILGEDVEIGPMTCIGIKTSIASGLRVPGGANIPEGSDIKTQEELEDRYQMEVGRLKDDFEKLLGTYLNRSREDIRSTGTD